MEKKIIGLAKDSGVRAWEVARFFARFCSDPRSVGAIVPSSPALARKMARLAKGFENVLELGSGSGAITKELYKSHHDRVWAVELDGELARRLERKFPKAKVIEGCAAKAIADAKGTFGHSAAIVSSLPFKSLPREIGDRIAQEIEGFLLEQDGRRLVQFTYAAKEPFELTSKELEWRKNGIVWVNTPPASVWVLERRASK